MHFVHFAQHQNKVTRMTAFNKHRTGPLGPVLCYCEADERKFNRSPTFAICRISTPAR